ncbi:MAG: site-specific DNA-methyltransferase [Deltaproteobacteria bacterium]|nr:site-specific DNA-methyltransferase [Deltaproteobacteria bacterium]
MKKLELTWIGKGDEPAVEPRILLRKPKLDYGELNAIDRSSPLPPGGWPGNMLIHGDNLIALKALGHNFSGQVKCVYIDPPYNTGSAFEHYDDNLEHSTWLSLMVPRLRILRKLLCEEGSIWINLDDNEAHYCKIICDELFGRKQFVGTVIWEKADSPRMDASLFSVRHDYILVYAKNIKKIKFNREKYDTVQEHYKCVDENGRRYYTKPLRVMGGNISESLFFSIIAPDGTEILPYENNGKKSCWRWSKKKVIDEADRIEWVNGKNGWNPYFRIYADTLKGAPAQTIWSHDEAGSNRASKRESKLLFGENAFGTPKPEKLLLKLLNIATSPGDIVLDSFLGSGTTAAVAHKMGRRYIGIELGEHCYTHCLPCLKAVVDGEEGGISKCVGWKGGGGFRFYELAPTLIVPDKYGQPIINEKFNIMMLVESVSKLHGFTFAPDPDIYWKQGRSQDNCYIYVTANYLSTNELDSIARDLKKSDRLMICALAFDIGLGKRYENIQIRKIPMSILSKCEYNKDNYNFNIIRQTKQNDKEL